VQAELAPDKVKSSNRRSPRLTIEEEMVMTTIPTVNAAVEARRKGVDRAISLAVAIGTVITAALVCALLYGIVTSRSAAVGSAASDVAMVFVGP
jgi:hypothetical protein